MNKKAQAADQLGIILMMFIGVLVGVILFQAVAQEAGKGLAVVDFNTSSDVGAASFTAPANGISIDLTGQDLLSTPVVTNNNGTYGVVVAANYTIDEGVSETTGVKTIQYTSDTADLAGQTLNISYTYGPDGYISDSGARSVVPLISIFFALAIAVIALSPTLRSGVMDLVNR